MKKERSATGELGRKIPKNPPEETDEGKLFNKLFKGEFQMSERDNVVALSMQQWEGLALVYLMPLWIDFYHYLLAARAHPGGGWANKSQDDLLLFSRDVFLLVRKIGSVWLEPEKPKGLGSKSNGDSDYRDNIFRTARKLRTGIATLNEEVKRAHWFLPSIEDCLKEALQKYEEALELMEKRLSIAKQRHVILREGYDSLKSLIGKDQTNYLLREALKIMKASDMKLAADAGKWYDRVR
jgi:hypothetical protein